MSLMKILKNEFDGYSMNSLKKDFLAGITCTAVALPLALAFGVSSGADAASGLICAIIAGFVIGGLSGSSYQISGPTGAMTAILAGLVMKYGLQGVFIAGFISGILLLAFALLRAGKLVNLIPMPVMTGFTSGIAVIIALGQIDNCFGTSSQGASAIEKIASYSTLGFSPQIYPIVFTLLAMLIMIFWPKKLQKVFPSSLLAIIVCLIVQLIIKAPVQSVGAIPRTLFPEARLSFSQIDFSTVADLIAPAFSIAVLGMVESLLCGAAAGKMKGEKIDSTQELIAQGIGNMIIPFFGGVPATAAIARTSVGIKAGGKTRMVSIFHSVGLLISMFLLGPFMSQIPLAALGGVLMMTAWRMNDFQEIKVFFKKRIKTSIAQFLVTMACTVVFDLTMAILIGVGFSMVLFVLKAKSELSIEVDNVDERNAAVVYVDGMLFFGTQDMLASRVDGVIGSGVKTIIFSLRGVPTIDQGGIEEILQIARTCRASEVQVKICGLQGSVEKMFRRLDVYDAIGKENIFSSAVTAIEALN
ncbi:MAG: SulP family inorganic anion transporter [Sphaerochaetaceae bacterium]